MALPGVRSGRHLRVTATVVVTAALCAPQPAGAAPGDVDTSWASGGKFSLSVGSFPSGIYAAAKQPDGKIVVAGFADNAGAAPFDADVMVARVNTDGSLDTSFNAAGAQPGVRTTPVSGTNDDYGYGVAIGPSGEIYVVGSTDPAGSDASDIAIVRYTSTGLLDTSFSTDGIQTIAQPDIGNGYAVAVQSDGKPIVVGSSSGGNGMQVMRLDPVTGALDTSYNAAGITPGLQEIPFGSSFTDAATSIVLQSDGKAVVGGTADMNTSSADFVLARLKTDGTLDTAGFGAGTGKVQTSLPNIEYAASVALDGDKIVLAGDVLTTSGTEEFIAARYLSDGSPDLFFGGSGVVTTAFVAADGTHYALGTGVLVEDGKVLVTGYAFNCPGIGCADFAIVRYTDDGKLDDSFGDGGKRTYGVGGESDFAWAAVPGSAILFGQVDMGGKSTGGGLKVSSTGGGITNGGTIPVTPPPPPKQADLRVVISHGLYLDEEEDNYGFGVAHVLVPQDLPKLGKAGFFGFENWFSGDTFEIAVTVVNGGPDAAESYAIDVRSSSQLGKPLTYRGREILHPDNSTALLGGPPATHLEPHETETLIYRGALAGPGPLTVTATVKNVSPTDPQPANNSASTTLAVSGRTTYSKVAWVPSGAGGDIKGRSSSKAASAASAAGSAGVEVAVLQRRGKACSWLTGASGKMRKAAASQCFKPVFLRASGKRRWHFHLRKAPPKGSYSVLVRPRAPSPKKAEREFGSGLHNLFRIRIR